MSGGLCQRSHLYVNRSVSCCFSERAWGSDRDKVVSHRPRSASGQATYTPAAGTRGRPEGAMTAMDGPAGGEADTGVEGPAEVDVVEGARRPRATMRDVAALAGVSLKTVSRVINREPGVSSALVAQVERAVAQLDYRPNMSASSLRRGDGKTAAIAAVLEDLANPFSASLLRALEDTAHERGVLIFAGSVDEDPRRERELVRA